MSTAPTKEHYKQTRTDLALVVIVSGVMMAGLDATIVILALPTIQRSLHSNLAGVIWIIISYLLVLTISATQIGKIGDMFGRIKTYELGFLIFVVGSALCAISFNLTSMIVFRIVQGIGATMISSNATAVVADIFPPNERGRAFGFSAFGYNVGSILGILVGGAIVSFISWRWIFWINLPIGIAAFIVALKIFNQQSYKTKQRIDWFGMITFGIGIFFILWAMTKLTTENFSLLIFVEFVIGLLGIGSFLRIESKIKDPMMPTALLKTSLLTRSFLASFFQAPGGFATLFLITMYLQGVRGLSPLKAALLLIPGYVLGGIVSPLSGKLSTKYSPVIPATSGIAIQIVALIIYSFITVTTPYWLIAFAAVLNGLGNGLFFPANTSATINATPREFFGLSGGVLRTFFNTGLIFSFALGVLVAGRSIPKHLAFAIFIGSTRLNSHLSAAFTKGIHSAFYALIVLILIAAVLSFSRIRPGKTVYVKSPLNS